MATPKSSPIRATGRQDESVALAAGHMCAHHASPCGNGSSGHAVHATYLQWGTDNSNLNHEVQYWSKTMAPVATPQSVVICSFGQPTSSRWIGPHFESRDAPLKFSNSKTNTKNSRMRASLLLTLATAVCVLFIVPAARADEERLQVGQMAKPTTRRAEQTEENLPPPRHYPQTRWVHQQHWAPGKGESATDPATRLDARCAPANTPHSPSVQSQRSLGPPLGKLQVTKFSYAPPAGEKPCDRTRRPRQHATSCQRRPGRAARGFPVPSNVTSDRIPYHSNCQLSKRTKTVNQTQATYPHSLVVHAVDERDESPHLIESLSVEHGNVAHKHDGKGFSNGQIICCAKRLIAQVTERKATGAGLHGRLRSQGALLDVATMTKPLASSAENNLLRISASATSVTWNSSEAHAASCPPAACQRCAGSGPRGSPGAAARASACARPA
ncbi:hypothetical protein ON010_g16183 [Phytophthora cinnamomi]|nr:hypothetical protein ON010_g16183 [Phytophthora cinnamomi]